MHHLSQRRAWLSFAFGGLALAAAIIVALSAALLDRRLVDARVGDQVDAIAADIGYRAAAGAPIRDYTGFHAAAAATVAAEETLRAIRIYAVDQNKADAAPLFEFEEAEQAATLEERILKTPILARSVARDALGPVGLIEAVLHARSWEERVGELPLLIVAATLVLVLIGVIYFAAVAEDASLRGRLAAAAWLFTALPPAAAMCVWLLSASAESYRETATVAADIAADRLRPAVSFNLDLHDFTELDEIFPVSQMQGRDGGGCIAFALIEGRKTLASAGCVVEGFWANWPWRLNVVRAVRPLTLSAPALTVTARLSWLDIARRSVRDHRAAIAAIIFYLFAPVAVLAARGRRKA